MCIYDSQKHSVSCLWGQISQIFVVHPHKWPIMTFCKGSPSDQCFLGDTTVALRHIFTGRGHSSPLRIYHSAHADTLTFFRSASPHLTSVVLVHTLQRMNPVGAHRSPGLSVDCRLDTDDDDDDLAQRRNLWIDFSGKTS